MLGQLAKANIVSKKELFMGSSKTGADSRIGLLAGCDLKPIVLKLMVSRRPSLPLLTFFNPQQLAS